jgi:sulfur-oxidizing protein SoxZ
MAKPRIKVPESAKVGEIIEIRSIIQHPMETGNRKDANGQLVPRDIIHKFTAKFAGQVFFEGELGPGISSNPSFAIPLKVPGPGALELTWVDDQGVTTVETVPLNVITG